MAAGTCGARLRSRAKTPAFPDPPEAAQTDAAQALADGAELMAAVRALPRRQREVLVLRFYLDLDVAEIAEMLKIGPSSVRSRACGRSCKPKPDVPAQSTLGPSSRTCLSDGHYDVVGLLRSPQAWQSPRQWPESQRPYRPPGSLAVSAPDRNR